MSKTFELIIFDWDGTLMDSAGRIVASLRAAAEDVNLEVLPDKSFSNVIGLGLKEAIEGLYPDIDDVFAEKFVERYRYHFLEACPLPESLFEGVKDLLTTLTVKSTLLGVATGKSRKGLDRVLNQTGCTRYFHATRCADETRSKPDPQMLLEILAELNVSAEKTLMVGDTEYDMEMARRAGVASLAVSYGVHESARLAQYDPLSILESVQSLSLWLEENI